MKNVWAKNKKIKAYYAIDLTNNGADFNQVISLWTKYWASEQQKKKLNSLSKTLKYISNNNLEVMLPNIKKVISILPIASATSALVALRFY